MSTLQAQGLPMHRCVMKAGTAMLHRFTRLPSGTRNESFPNSLENSEGEEGGASAAGAEAVENQRGAAAGVGFDRLAQGPATGDRSHGIRAVQP